MKKVNLYKEAKETFDILLRYKVQTVIMVKLNDRMMFIFNDDNKALLRPIKDFDFIFDNYNTEFVIEICDDKITKPLLAAKTAFLENICAGSQYNVASEERRDNTVIIKDNKVFCTGQTLLHAGIWCATLKDIISRVVVEN